MLKWVLVAIATVSLVGVLVLFRDEPEVQKESALSLAEVLSGPDQGFARALEVRPFSFPEDHGPHPMFRTEWWYYTGNLENASGRAFGFQFTLFRSALSPAPEKRESRWAANQVYMAHLALTDVETGGFHAFERFARGAMGLAGATADPFRLWLEDWRVEGALPSMRLEAFEKGRGVHLSLESAKPIVLQGDRGLSRKGGEPGNASYYYSLTRLEAKGVVRLPGEAFEVTGSAWMDREWSTSVLEEEQVGWDWFALQLDRGEELMFYRMRRADGSADPFSRGCWVDAEGRATALAVDEVSIETLDTWKNRDGASYPSRWRLSIPGRDTVLEVKPLLSDQELRFGITYWEGTVSVQGMTAGGPVRGKGYVELTGYAGTPVRR